MSKEILQDIINDFSLDKFGRFFREKNRSFASRQESLNQYNDDSFKEFNKIGEIKFSETQKLLIITSKANNGLIERSGKKAQYEKAKKILKEHQSCEAGIFVFYDTARKNFRFSLVYDQPIGTKRTFSNFRRFTYFVSSDPEVTNKTFLTQIGSGDFSTLEKVKAAFSLQTVTDIFYEEFFKEYNKLVEAVKKENKEIDNEKSRDFVLLFAVRTIFLGFIQKKGWIGNDEKFIQRFFKEYEAKHPGKNLFYESWLSPLFFEALNTPVGRKTAYSKNDFSPETEKNLQMAPYLNGGLFKEKPGYDNQDYLIPDKEIKSFYEFLFSHNFTIEENSFEDEDLQLNPEFLGIIFERLVNKANGAVYTPRTEVDLMCRLTLVKWIEKNSPLPVSTANLYELFFREGEKEEDQKQGSFSEKETKEIIGLLENITICDPAVGSGAFLVGMILVIDEIEQNLKTKIGLKDNNSFERKKRIIGQSLYGVEVKEWAVWICQLRLWLSLFIEAPDDMKNSLEPILPSLDFKVRQGDSLVQRIGSKAFPVLGHAQIDESVKRKVTLLKNLKNEYFGNKTALKDWEVKQKEIAIYNEILQSEIKEKQNKIHNLKNTGKNLELFSDDALKPNQNELPLNKEQIEQLENEVNELEEQKHNIRKDKPLIWNIEFAEVFVEKGGFDIVIGNPPYVRQEDISDPTGKIRDKKQYKAFLEEMVKLDFPESFPQKAKINAQSDLYTYFYIRGLRLLNNKGIHTFICSNSWLDVGYGAWLQKFLLERAPVELIIDNHAKRSFKAADVNTIISIIHAPVKKPDNSKPIKFVAFKKPFEEAIFTEYLLQIEEAKEVVSNDIFRVYPKKQIELLEEGWEYPETDSPKQLLKGKFESGSYIGDKWGGKYLRAPDIFFTILEKGKGKLVKLGDIAEVRFGIKTGVNEFFYLTDAQTKEWKIEKEFLKPVIKSPKECKSILINPKDLKYKIFICNKSKEELKGTNALKYIQWGEKQKTEDGIYWKDVSSVAGRKHWWEIGIREYPSLIFPCGIRERFITYVNENNILADKRLYDIFISKNNKTGLSLSLNATYIVLMIEIQSHSYGGGGGLIDATVIEVEKLTILNPSLFKINGNRSINVNREIKSIFEECGIDPQSKNPIEEQEPKPLHDRAELDKIVFDALDLTKDERKEVYRAVCRLVWNRISKAKSV
ncbi:MAG: Eco57I restriction-modification methylase domain-containing protein [Elusimicrobia bacterium]|nr:Eco57I restriction-modification methylase domain-containing protein [Elusimicrobiota bacterium]